MLSAFGQIFGGYRYFLYSRIGYARRSEEKTTEYSSIYGQTSILKPELVVETYVALLPFPTTKRFVDKMKLRDSFQKLEGYVQICQFVHQQWRGYVSQIF